MDTSKPWYKSKTILGGLVALLAGIASIFGYTVGGETQELLTGSLVALGSAVGGVLAVYGRVKAEGKVTK